MKAFHFLFFIIPFAGNAQQFEVNIIEHLLDEWHMAAANADSTIFFGTMAEDALYIGTDMTERWDKNSFVIFAKPYFARGTAWDFKPYDRLIILGDDKETAWFSELLDTWMGTCRGSGILTKESGGEWKIRQYHLAVTVPNDQIQNFIKLIEEFDPTNSQQKK